MKRRSSKPSTAENSFSVRSMLEDIRKQKSAEKKFEIDPAERKRLVREAAERLDWLFSECPQKTLRKQ